MLYFDTTQLSYTYHVSVRTVRNWITQAKQGKLDLELHTENGKTYVANTSGNIKTIERMVELGKKRRNRRAHKIIEPCSEFYRVYTEGQIYDLVTDLEVHREIRREYNYFDGGAKYWDAHIKHIEEEGSPSNLTMTRKLLSDSEKYIDGLLSEYDRINVVDIGVGNAFPVKDLLAHLLENGKLGRYIAIDISAQMLEIAESNVKEWFDGRVAFEGYEMDISRERFANILAEGYISDAPTTGNLILFLGGTIQNFRKQDRPWQVINDSMGTRDLLIHTQKLDSEATRRHFYFSQPGESSMVPPIHGFIVKMLNIDPSLYELEVGYDEARRERYERLRFKMALTIKFKFTEGERSIDFNRGEQVLLWRASQDTAFDVIQQLGRNDFYVLGSSQTADQEYMLTVSRLKRD